MRGLVPVSGGAGRSECTWASVCGLGNLGLGTVVVTLYLVGKTKFRSGTLRLRF